MKRPAILLNTIPAHARCSVHSDMPHKLAVVLSVICISCVMTVMADETRWQQYQNAGTEAYQQGDYSEAVRQIKLALKEAEDFGEEDPRFAISLNNLAELYRAQGRYSEAEPIYKRSLAIREKTLGPEHPAVATSLNNLGALYLTQGLYDEAEPLFKRALPIYEKAQGPEHLNVAASLNNLAELYRAQGRYAEAEPIYKRSLAIQEKALGPEHPAVATSLNNLALLYESQGRYDEAEPMYERSLAIVEKTLGPDHPNVATNLNNLGALYRLLGRYEQAEPMYTRSLAIFEKTLGPEHPDVAQSLNNLAELYQSQGRYDEAEPMYKRALAIAEKTLGPEHPAVATSLNNLASLYESQGRYDEAEPMYERSLAMLEKTLGPEHPDVASSLNNLAQFYRTQGRNEDTERLLREHEDRVRDWKLESKKQDEPVREITLAKSPQTFKKVWYRGPKKPLMKAYSASGTLTVNEGSLEFTSEKINLNLTGKELVRVGWGRMKQDTFNDWAILSYNTGDVEVTVGFKDGSRMGWGGNTRPIYDALKEAIGPRYRETADVSSPAFETAGDDAEILDAVDAAVTVAKKHGFQYDDSDSKNGRVVVNTLWKEHPITLRMRFFKRMGSLYIASGLEQPAKAFMRRGGQKIERNFYSDLLKETTRRGLTIYSDPEFPQSL